MNKKILALVLAVAMVFSTMTVAFAATDATIGADAQAAATIGILQGNGSGVTPEYLALTPTRMQAAIMFLRLKGLEQEALAYTGTENFADANTLTWAGGKAIMGYLKTHPELGWLGIGGNKFAPNGTIAADQYYKVMLEALGYKQDVDFTWDQVISFAASKGLTKVASVTKFTNNDLAIATIEALKVNVKGSDKTLATILVEAGKIDAAKAIEAGIIEDNNATSTVKAVKSIGNTKVEVEFNDAISKTFAENANNYKIVEKGTTTALEVKSAVLDGTKKVVVETAAQTAGKAYTMTVGSVSMNFGGVAKDTAAAELDSVKGTDTERVELTFTKILDLSALDAANYTINNGVTVVSAKWADSSRKVVELTTSGMTPNKTYTVTASNIKTVDLVNLKSASKSFMSKSDKTAPTANINKAISTNNRIMVYFNEEVSQATAENLANYSLTVGSTTSTLDITAAKLVEDVNDINKDGDDEDMSVVELTTASQKAGTKYVLHVKGIADTSVLGNVMTKEQTIDYYGIKADESKPTVSSIDYVTNKIIDVKFNEASRLDPATALDINNYSVNNDITVESAAFVKANNPDSTGGKTVRLTVSELGDKSSYTVTVSSVADEFGNVMDTKKTTKTFNKTTVNTPATISKVEATSETTVKVTFTKEVNEASAEDVSNYSINNGLGTPIKASLDDNGRVVTLTVPEMTMNKSYEITLNGVTDLAGNVIANVKAKFVASATENDITAPEILDITAVNDRVIRITFDEAMDVDGAAPQITFGNNKTATYTVSTDDDDMVLEFLIDNSADYFKTEDDVKLLSTTAADLAGNVAKVDEDGIVFSTTSDAPEKIELVSWEQVSAKKFKLIFAEKVQLVGSATITDTASTVVPYQLTVSIDKDDKTIVYLTANQVMASDKEFKLDLSSILKSYNGVEIDESNDGGLTVLETGIEDEDAPYMESVTAKDNKNIKVVYSEDMATAGTYTITYVDNDGKTQTMNSSDMTAAIDSDNSNEVNIALKTKTLDARYTYTLHIGSSRAKDIANNPVDSDAEFDFEGTNMVAIGNYISGVSVINGTKIKVNTYSSINPADITVEVVYGDNETVPVVFNPATGANADKNSFTVTIDTTNGLPMAAYLKGTDYTVRLTDAAAGKTYEYTFAGVVEEGITVQKVGTDYQVSYADAAQGDKIQFILADGTILPAYTVDADKTAVAPVADLNGATAANIMVVRNGVVIYYDSNVDLQ